jgi:hypothetical protein
LIRIQQFNGYGCLMTARRQCGRMTRRFRNYLTVLAISLLMWTVILGVVYWLFR